MFLVSELETMSTAGIFQWCGPINEEYSVIDSMFLAKFGEESVCKNLCSRRFERCMEQFVRFGIDGCVQPIPLGIESNHRLINRNVIRRTTVFRL